MQVFDFDSANDELEDKLHQLKGWYRKSSSGNGFHAIILDGEDCGWIRGDRDRKFGEKIFFNNKGDLKAGAWRKIGNHTTIFPYISQDVFLFKIGNVFMICSIHNDEAIESFIDIYADSTSAVYYSEHNATILSNDWDGYIYTSYRESHSDDKNIQMKIYHVP